MKNFDNIFDHAKRNEARESDFKKRDSGKKRFGGRDDRERRGRPEMFEATCSACGKRCEVPFRPTGDKPVYCSECFSKQGSSNSSRFERRDYNKPRFQDKRMFEATCDKCGKRFELPFRPTGEKPVYCKDCFDRGGNTGSKNSVNGNPSQYKEQFDMLNAKLDRIIKVLIPAAPAKEEKKEAPKAAAVEKKEKQPAKKAPAKKMAKKPVIKKKKGKK
jgi:CxxC-x17-CxxC domain-containing protein